MHRFRSILLAGAVVLPLAGCIGDDAPSRAGSGAAGGLADARQRDPLPPIALDIAGPTGIEATAATFLQGDVQARGGAGRLEAGADSRLAIRLSTELPDGTSLVPGGFHLARAGAEFVVAATGVLGLQAGAYEVMEQAGAVFHHPVSTAWPRAWCTTCVTELGTHNPHFEMRGTHVHTMHPIEFESTLLGSDAATQERFKLLAGWLISRQQNYLEWNLLRTVDFGPWLEHAGELVDLAHARGLRMGIVAPFAFQQQNSYTLIDPDSSAPATAQIAAEVDTLMAADWDFINVEMGASEFFSVSDVDQVEWLSFLAQYTDEAYGIKSATKVHITVDQHAPNYDGMNFNYIAQFADPRMGVMPHTVQWYDLYRAAPTYDREDNDDMRAFLLSQIGDRPVYYYPETAYWVTFDNDVPLFLPHYVWARWNDLHRLRDSGMDGQINFSSGFEWGYWLNDYAAAWYAARPGDPYLAPVERALQVFGEGHADAVALLDEVIRWQGDVLLEDNGIRWLIAWGPEDDIGHFVGIHAQPIRTRLYELWEMDAAALDAFERQQLPQLEAIAAATGRQAERWTALAPKIDSAGLTLFEEIELGLHINHVRAEYMLTLYRALLHLRRGDLGVEADGEEQAEALWAEAEVLIEEGLAIVRRQESTYRFPHAEIAQERESFTSYPFGYLRTVTDLWYWERELKMAKDPDGFDFLDSLYNLVESGGF